MSILTGLSINILKTVTARRLSAITANKPRSPIPILEEYEFYLNAFL